MAAHVPRIAKARHYGSDMPRNRASGGGRPRLDRDRHLFVTRLDRPYATVVQEGADELDLSYSEYIGRIVAIVHGFGDHLDAATQAHVLAAVPQFKGLDIQPRARASEHTGGESRAS